MASAPCSIYFGLSASFQSSIFSFLSFFSQVLIDLDLIHTNEKKTSNGDSVTIGAPVGIGANGQSTAETIARGSFDELPQSIGRW